MFFDNHSICEVMWKNSVERGRPDDNMADAHFMLDT